MGDVLTMDEHIVYKDGSRLKGGRVQMLVNRLGVVFCLVLGVFIDFTVAQCECSCPAPIAQVSSCSCPLQGPMQSPMVGYPQGPMPLPIQGPVAVPPYTKPRKKKRRGCPSPMPCPFPPPDPIPPICPEPPSCNVDAGGGLSFPVDAKAGSYSPPIPPPSYPTRTRTRRALTHVDPEKCNNDDLKNIMTSQIVESPTASKRNIQSVAAIKLNATYDVICSYHEFSYLATTRIYCEVQKGEVTCFAFLH